MTTEPKSFWQRPEGKAGWLTIAGLAAAGAYGFSLILPWLQAFVIDATTLAVNVVHLGMVVGAALVALLVVSDRDFRTNVSYGFKLAMRKMTGALITIDPIEIMKIARDKLASRVSEMDKALADLGGQLFKLEQDIRKADAERAHSLAIAGEAKKAKNQAAFVLNARQAGRLRESNLSLVDMLKRMRTLHSNLKKAREAANFLIADMGGEIKEQERKRNAMRAGYKAMLAGKSVLQGGTDRAMYDEAMEASANDYAMKAGEIEQFMDASKGFIDGVDLENRAWGVEALAEIEKWDDKIDKIYDPAASKVRIAADVDEAAVGDAEVDEAVERTSFTDLFDDRRH